LEGIENVDFEAGERILLSFFLYLKYNRSRITFYPEPFVTSLCILPKIDSAVLYFSHFIILLACIMIADAVHESDLVFTKQKISKIMYIIFALM
jgi:hypothetical protein